MNLVASSSSDAHAAAAMLMKMEKTDSNFENSHVVNVNGKENVVRITISPATKMSLSSKEVRNMDAKVIVKNYSNFKESGSPGRVMYYSEDGSWVDYSSEVVELVRGYFEQKNPLVEVNQGGFRCLLDFCRMLEIEIDSGKVRSIAWIDVNRKCFFPNSFVGHVKPSPRIDLELKVCENRGEFEEIMSNRNGSTPADIPKIDLELKVCENGGELEEIKSNRNGSTPAESWNYPVKQSPKIDLELKVCENGGEFEEIESNQNGTAPVEIELGLELDVCENRGEFEEIEKNAMSPNTTLLNEAEIDQKTFTYHQFKNFLQSAIRIAEPEAIVTRIHKCVGSNPLHEVFRNQLKDDNLNKVDPNVVFAWFGTSAIGVESILANGFDISNQLQCPQGYGVCGGGLFFSPVMSPHHSAVMSEVDKKGEKHMILCRIMLGRCEKATDADSLQRLAYSKDSDTAVLESKNARYYVVWPDKINTHILPEAVVRYNPGSTLNSQFRESLSRKMVSIAGLLSGLKKSLPRSKGKELHALYGSFKSGRIGRDVFARRLRLIVGDEKLRSVIREIHG